MSRAAAIPPAADSGGAKFAADAPQPCAFRQSADMRWRKKPSRTEIPSVHRPASALTRTHHAHENSSACTRRINRRASAAAWTWSAPRRRLLNLLFLPFFFPPAEARLDALRGFLAASSMLPRIPWPRSGRRKFHRRWAGRRCRAGSGSRRPVLRQAVWCGSPR